MAIPPIIVNIDVLLDHFLHYGFDKIKASLE
jgi:hypothetical protein